MADSNNPYSKMIPKQYAPGFDENPQIPAAVQAREQMKFQPNAPEGFGAFLQQQLFGGGAPWYQRGFDQLVDMVMPTSPYEMIPGVGALKKTPKVVDFNKFKKTGEVAAKRGRPFKQSPYEKMSGQDIPAAKWTEKSDQDRYVIDKTDKTGRSDKRYIDRATNKTVFKNKAVWSNLKDEYQRVVDRVRDSTYVKAHDHLFKKRGDLSNTSYKDWLESMREVTKNPDEIKMIDDAIDEFNWAEKNQWSKNVNFGHMARELKMLDHMRVRKLGEGETLTSNEIRRYKSWVKELKDMKHVDKSGEWFDPKIRQIEEAIRKSKKGEE